MDGPTRHSKFLPQSPSCLISNRMEAPVRVFSSQESSMEQKLMVQEVCVSHSHQTSRKRDLSKAREYFKGKDLSKATEHLKGFPREEKLARA